MGLYNRFCKRFFAAVIIRLTANNHSGKKTLTEPITQTHNFEFWTARRTDSAAAAASAAPGVETKRNQRRSQNQPTRYYDQAPAMNWDHAVSWGWGVWVSVSDIGRVGSGWPLYTNP